MEQPKLSKALKYNIVMTLKNAIDKLGLVPDECDETVNRVISEAGMNTLNAVIDISLALEVSAKVGTYDPLIKTVKEMREAFLFRQEQNS